MRDLQGRNSWKRFFYSDIVAIVLLVILFFIARNVFDVYTKDTTAQKKLELAQLNLSALNDKKLALKDNVDKLKTDRGVEEELRRRFQVSKEGEQVLVIVDKNEGKKEVEVEVPKTWLQDFWDKFLDIVSFK
ncbi:MAG: septum formation initiator family protein [bacterium]